MHSSGTPVDMEGSVGSRAKDEEKEDAGVTVALHKGLPNPSAAEMSSLLSSSSDINCKEHGEIDDSGFTGSSINKGQYWTPTPSRILIGPTQFSCPVCVVITIFKWKMTGKKKNNCRKHKRRISFELSLSHW